MKRVGLVIALMAVTLYSYAMEFTVHHAPGGPSDRATRAIAKYLPSEYVVVNRPGAGGRIAVRHLIKNNSMMVATTSQIFVTNMLSNQDVGYSPLRDLSIIGNVAIMPNVLVCRSELGYKTLSDIGNKSLNFAVAGYGSSEHIATETLFTRLSGKHLSIPYALGGSSSANDLLGGTIDCMFANYPTIKPFINDKKITVIMTSHDVGLNVSTWQSMFNEPFPFQSYLSIVISSRMEESDRKKAIADLTAAFSNTELSTDLKSLGLFPVLDHSSRRVERELSNLMKFIQTSNIKIQ